LEKLFYFVLVAVSNQDGVSFYSDARLAELLEIRFPHELEGARQELGARDLIAYEGGIYQVLALPAGSPRQGRGSSSSPSPRPWSSSSSSQPIRRTSPWEATSDFESVRQLLERWSRGPKG
jgi:hypothetical protein